MGAGRPNVVVLGGGPAGVGAAYQLRRQDRARVTLLERGTKLGGNAGSFCIEGQPVDFGSHRLHYSCDPRILHDIRALLGDDLIERKRRGRIRLAGKWIRFPLKPLDLVLRLDRSFALGALSDALRKGGVGALSSDASFAEVLRANLGPTICDRFYFPYARKIWGREPEELSGIQARKRVTAGTFKKLMKRLVKAPGGGRFFYPRRGFGQISESFGHAAADLGADVLTGWSAVRLSSANDGGGGWVVEAEGPGGERRELDAEHVWSTIPITALARIVSPPPPERVIRAGSAIEYRAMVLVYQCLEVDRFSPTDAHYFPEESVAMSRLSEPKNYSGASGRAGRTVLCAELPCTIGDEIWSADDTDLGRLVADDMAAQGLPLPVEPYSVTTRRLPQAYPIYRTGYEAPLNELDDWARSLPNVLTYGRQGLFAHDNTHHALYMAYSAVDCLTDTGFDEGRWAEYRREFAAHVVED